MTVTGSRRAVTPGVIVTVTDAAAGAAGGVTAALATETVTGTIRVIESPSESLTRTVTVSPTVT